MVLRQNRLTSLEAYRAPIARLVQAGDPAVLDALFGPVEWTCVEYGFPLGGRGLTVHWTAGHAAPLRRIYADVALVGRGDPAR
jgi:hypothetical protein